MIEINQQEEKKIEIKDNSKRAKILLSVFWVLTGLILVGLLTGYHELQILKNIQIGEFVSEEEANLSDLLQQIIGLVQLGLYIVSVVVFLNWFRRAYGNLHRAGTTDTENKETMAIWCWFVPFVWFYKPLQIMNRIWTKTQENIKKFDPTYVMKSGKLIITLWWILFILSNFIGRYVFKTAFKQDTIEQLIESSEATLIYEIIQISEALLIILIVYKLSKIENQLADEVKKHGGNIVST